MVSNGVLTLRARFAPGGFDARTTRLGWVLDTDGDPATGSPGLFGAPGTRSDQSDEASDNAIIGAEAVALVTGICDSGSLTRYNQLTKNWMLADILPTLILPTGFDAYVAVDSLDANPNQIALKAIAYSYSGDCPAKSINYQVTSISPGLGAPTARAQHITTYLATPHLIDPADHSTFDQYPRRTALEWSGIAGAAAYLVQAQYADATAPSGWRPLIFERHSDLRTVFNFVGAQAGRWRVWGLSPDGLAGIPSAWRTFRYLR